jgi:hypothetical protein
MNIQHLFRLVFLLLFVLVFAFSCGKQKAKWQGTIEEVDGITIVRNPEEPLYPDKIINFEEDLSIGVEEGNENYMFSNPIDIDSDSEGNIYVLDLRELTIKKYDANGIFKKTIGRKGQGPGEFQYPYGFCIDGSDFIYITDAVNRRIDILDCEGVHQDTLVLDFSCSNISDYSENKLVVYYNLYKQRDEERRKVSKVGIFDIEQNKISDFYEIERPLFNSIQSKEYRIDLPSERFDVDSNGNLYIGNNDKYEINVYEPSGNKFLIFSKLREPIPLDPEIKAKALKQLSKSSFPTDLGEYENLIKYHSFFNSLSIDENDRIWIKLFQLFDENETKRFSLYDIFSTDGKYLFTTKIDRGISGQLIFKNGFAYGLTRDELGYSKAVRLRVSEN